MLKFWAQCAHNMDGTSVNDELRKWEKYAKYLATMITYYGKGYSGPIN